ncbi:MAG TPA: hypothetical protein VGX23_18255 [Actinocrinis sp.]|nr:hypothetical protein [Actinocrinis sp.]
MMYGYGNGTLSGWDWILMATSMIVFWGALISIGVIWYRGRTRTTRTRPPAGHQQSAPEHILAERYARGEMDENQYSAQLATLRRSARS